MSNPTVFEQLAGFLRGDPGNLPLLQEAVHQGLAAGRAEAALSLIDGFEASPGDAAATAHLRSSVLLALGRAGEAELVLRAIAEAGPLAPASRFNLAYALWLQGRHDEAVPVWQALVDEPQGGVPPGALAGLLRCLRSRDGIAAALQAWERSVPAARDAQAQGVASMLYFDADDAARARELAHAAWGAGSRHHETVAVLAGVLTLERRADEALALLGPALQQAPQDGRLWSMRAAALMGLGDLVQARAAYEQAVRFVPQHIGTWHGLGWCQIAQQDLAGARESMERALTLDRNFAESHGGMAVVDALSGRREAAEASIKRALGLDAGSLSARYAQAVLAGDTADRAAFQRLALRLLGSRAAPLGGTLAEAIGLAGRADDPPPR